MYFSVWHGRLKSDITTVDNDLSLITPQFYMQFYPLHLLEVVQTGVTGTAMIHDMIAPQCSEIDEFVWPKRISYIQVVIFLAQVISMAAFSLKI